jgi:hypothetical protein
LSSVATRRRAGRCFADPRIDRAPLKDRDIELQTDLARRGVDFEPAQLARAIVLAVVGDHIQRRVMTGTIDLDRLAAASAAACWA